MRYVNDTSGRFIRRPHYEPAELDLECERIINDFLMARHGGVAYPILTDDLTVLVERDSEDLDLFADLSGEGADVQGVTYFYHKQKPRVLISRELSEDKGRENRLRTTLTHEYCHVKFHDYVWQLDAAPQDLVRSVPSRASPKCKRDGILNAPAKDWMEWQAGHVCGALLMPVGAVKRVASQFCQERNLYLPIPFWSREGTDLRNLVMECFHVSAEAAEVRMRKLSIFSDRDLGPTLFGR